MLTLDSIVRRGALTSPDRTALIDVTDGVEWTWAEFDHQVSSAAEALRRSGLGPGDRVAAADINSATYFALYFGAARAGVILCPLNYLMAPPELEYVLADFDPHLVLAGPAHLDLVRAAAQAAIPKAEVLAFRGADADWTARVGEADPLAEAPPIDPDSLHLVLYTSGTTGKPKGAAHTQAAHYLDGVLTALAYRLTPSDRYLVHAPSFHAACWDHAKIFWVADGSVVVSPRFEPQVALDALSRHRVSVLFGVPAVLKALVDHPSFPQHDLSALRLVYYGGAIGSPTVLHDFAAALGRDIDYMHVYGLTEGGPFVSCQPPERVLDKPDSIGWPLPGVEMAIADPESGELLPWGETGEIVVRAPTNMSGYWNRPEESAHALRGGWLHTDDLGRRDADGDFYIVDRLKDMVRTGGENVYAKEVELVLMAHPAVTEAAVVGLADPRWDERVVAAITVMPGSTVDVAELQEFCRERLARYKVPKDIVVVDAFPRTGLGKISKHQLRDRLATQEDP